MLILLFENKNWIVFILFMNSIYFKYIFTLECLENTHGCPLDTQIHKSLGMDLFFQIQKSLDLGLGLTKLNGSRSGSRSKDLNQTLSIDMPRCSKAIF